MSENTEMINLLKSIDTKLGRLLGDFGALTAYEKQIATMAAIDSTNLAEIYDVTENDPNLIEMRKQQEQADKLYRIDAAMRVQEQDKSFEIAAQVGKDAFDKNRKRAVGL